MSQNPDLNNLTDPYNPLNPIGIWSQRTQQPQPPKTPDQAWTHADYEFFGVLLIVGLLGAIWFGWKYDD